jgi:hypothetical protein
MGAPGKSPRHARCHPIRPPLFPPEFPFACHAGWVPQPRVKGPIPSQKNGDESEEIKKLTEGSIETLMTSMSQGKSESLLRYLRMVARFIAACTMCCSLRCRDPMLPM